MKIEKLNDRQIRCTLTKADLADRQLKLSELAYGTEKAKALFRDMVQQASLKFGFEAEDIPLMIEAVPLNSDCIVLIITKVEDPEELDTRFSRFSPSALESSDDEENSDVLDHVPEENSNKLNSEIMDLFNRIKNEAANIIGDKDAELSVSISEVQDIEKAKEKPSNITKIFSFDSMYELLAPANAVSGFYNGSNSLYKDNENGGYLLVLNKYRDDKESFNRACNIISEYGRLERLTPVSEAYFKEHFEILISEQALQKLSTSK